jgi:hypothetical protein
VAKQVEMKRIHWFIIFLALGIVLGTTNLFAPLHEMAHVASAARQGIDAEVTGWSTSQINSFSPTAILAGWTWEVVWALILATILCFVGRHYPKLVWVTGAACLGYAFITWIRAFSSDDFNSVLMGAIAGQLDDKSDLPQLWQQVHDGLSTRWALIGGAFLMTVSIITVKFSLKSIPQKRR